MDRIVGELRAVRVPPPKKVVPDDVGEKLGLLPGLRAKRDSGGRCSECGCWRSDGDWLVWVPDSVEMRDSESEVIEQIRVNTYNGHFSGWCLDCAKKLGGKASSLPLEVQPTVGDGFYMAIFFAILAALFAGSIVWVLP